MIQTQKLNGKCMIPTWSTSEQITSMCDVCNCYFKRVVRTRVVVARCLYIFG